MHNNTKHIWLVALPLFMALAACHDNGTDTDEPYYPGIDSFEGRIKEFFLTDETDRFDASECELKILAPDQSVISRKGIHTRSGGRSIFQLETGLKEGEYRLLYIEYPIEPIVSEDGSRTITTRQFGLGCSISADKHGVTVSSSYDSRIGLSGSGTQEDPYIVSSYDHLMTLAHDVNSDVYNSFFTEDTYIRQIVDIDMDDACFFTDHRYGWEPIGNDCNLPFRSIYQGAGLSNIWSLRDKSPAIGLFGYIHRARIDGVKISRSEFSGNFAVGSVAGASITSGTHRDRSEITNCRVSDSKITGSKGSLAIGGILGVADMNSRIMLFECHNENSEVAGDYGVGGVIGTASAYSLSSINNCTNSGRIRSGFSGAGGIVGTCDTIYITAAKNFGEVKGASDYEIGDKQNGAIGAGGIVGGSGMAFVTGCENGGKVEGVYGVGGLLGSTRVKGDENSSLIYNDAAFRYCYNHADVTGIQMVGGINGESQFGCFGVINKGNVTADSYIGGIVGNTSIAVAHNAVNTGKVTGQDYIAGIVGKSTFASLALNDNYGEISATGHHTGGIVALAGNNTIMHYCGNHGDIINPAGNYVGGLVGEIGDPRKWTGMNTAECVIGAMEIVMGIAGPCISYAEHALEESLHAVSLILKYGEFVIDSLLHATDLVLWTDGLVGIVSGESSEEVSSAIQTETYDTAYRIKDLLKATRTTSTNYHTGDLSPVPLYSDRGGFVSEHADWYASTGNDEIFNDAINEVRNERLEANEKVEHSREIFFECIGGVCLVVGTAASIGAMVASGGTATALIAVGTATSIVGGVSAIVKTCTEFENNAVVISQCVNSGNLRGNGNSGALAGSLHDASEIRDCLVTGSGTNSEKVFCGHFGNRATARRCINAGKNWEGHDTGHGGCAGIRKDGAGAKFDTYYEWDGGNIVYIDAKWLSVPDLYQLVDETWDISDGSGTIWNNRLKEKDNYYPVPARSEMRK